MKYDALVVGGGIAGLTVTANIAKSGRSVAIIAINHREDNGQHPRITYRMGIYQSIYSGSKPDAKSENKLNYEIKILHLEFFTITGTSCSNLR